MDQFYINVYEQIIYRWLIVNKDYYEKKHIHFFIDDKDAYKFVYEYENIVGIIQFWPKHHIIEETILNESQEMLFYLHFNIRSLGNAKKFITDFFHQLLSIEKPRHIGMSCSCGITSSVFVENITRLSQFMNLPYQFDVVSIHEIENSYHDYDLIILAPQTAYLEPYLKAKCQDGCPIISIDALLFATNNYNQTLTMIQNIFKE